jgi:murein DD-endopeptidase MepM/ murein hydrolase activator NlpD
MRRGLAALFALLLLTQPAWAQKGRMGGGGGMSGGGFAAQHEPGEEDAPGDLSRRGLFTTGLEPRFPEGVDCPPISSPFGSPFRYDGSPRSNDFGGLHNGMDITLDPGTPLLAVADGEVVHAGTAGRLVGNFIWLRFPPEATGLPAYVFAKYQHLNTPSPLKPGDRVRQGNTVGLSGNTGTTGGHYGLQGYDHLHINLLVSDEPGFQTKGPMLRTKTITYLDPLGLYAQTGESFINNNLLRSIGAAKKSLPVSVMTQDGRLVSAGPKPIWPVACKAK